MIEKVNPSHPDKIADRIGGAIVDYCYSQKDNPKVAVEVLLGHGYCTVIVESDVKVTSKVVKPIVDRIAGEGITLKLISVPQDEHLAENQSDEIRCGDNGIFKGVPLSREEIELTTIAQEIYTKYPSDGKYILDEESGKLIVCQSCCDSSKLDVELYMKYVHEYEIIVNPLGDWTGGTDVDTGAINRKLGSDMYRSISGGGIHGKDFSKADVSVNIYCFLESQRTGKEQHAFCAIGDTHVLVNGYPIPYSEIVEHAKEYVQSIGGFEKLAEWGLW